MQSVWLAPMQTSSRRGQSSKRQLEKLGLAMNEQELAPLVDVRPVRDTQLLQLSVEHTDPQIARDLANAVARTFIRRNEDLQQTRLQSSRESLRQGVEQVGRELDERTRALNALRSRPANEGEPDQDAQAEGIRLTREVSDLQLAYATLLRSYEEVRVTEVRSTNTLVLMEPAVLPSLPIRPRVLLNTLLGAVVGLLLAVSVVLLQAHLDDRVSTLDRLDQALGVPTIAVGGKFAPGVKSPFLANLGHLTAQGGTLTPSSYHSAEAEAYRMVRTILQFRELDSHLRAILVTSPGPDEGKTTTAVNLALAFAQAGFRTLLVDADLRNPSIHRLFGVANDGGLSTLLLRRHEPASAWTQATNVPNLWVLTSGPLPPNPSGLLGSDRLSARLTELRAEADYLILDSPPTLEVAGTLALASQVDGVILAVDARTAREGPVVRTREALEGVGARIVGAVLNCAPQTVTNGHFLNRHAVSSNGQADDFAGAGRDSHART